MAFGDYDFAMLANASQQIAVTGSIVRVRSCTGKINIRIDGGPGANFSAGQGFKMPPGTTFRDLTIKDASGAPNLGVIFIGDASYDDTTFSGAVQVTNTSGAFAQTVPAVTNASANLVGANAARRYFLFQNVDPIANVYLNLAGAAATVGNGVKVPPGGSYELQGFVTNTAITAIADQATADVRVVEG